MHQVRTVKQLKDAVEQAVFEFEELSVCAREDLDDELYDYSATFEAMAQKLKLLSDELKDCEEYSQRQGLSFMSSVAQLRPIIPFYGLIESIDSACRQGVREI